MRKLLELLSAAALFALFAITGIALCGADRLPDKIPVRFNFDGQPTAWGSSAMLLLLPLCGLVLYSLLTLVSRFPSTFSYPVATTTQNRSRLQAITVSLIATLKAETLVLFALLQYFTIHAARTEHLNQPLTLMLPAVAVILLTVAAHIVAMNKPS